MKRVRIAELKDHLSQHLRAAKAGVVVEVTDRDRPIARIVPIDGPAAVTLRPPVRPFASIRRRTYPPAGWSTRSTQLLARERRDR